MGRWIVVAALLLSATWAWGDVPATTQTETVPYSFSPLPVQGLVNVPQFDTQNGERVLCGLEFELSTVVSADLRIVNDGVETQFFFVSLFGLVFLQEPAASQSILLPPAMSPLTGTPMLAPGESVDLAAATLPASAMDAGVVGAGPYTGTGTFPVFVSASSSTQVLPTSGTATVLNDTATGVVTVRYSYTLATGACCLPDGTCVERTTADCAVAGGVHQGAGTTCPDPACPIMPTGACCFTDGTCAERVAADCGVQGGAYQGDGTACPDPNCVAAPVLGACCFADGACLLLTGAECAGQGGAYQGDGTTCPDPNCVAAPVFGACCFVDGACLLLTGAECAGQGGAYQGDGTTCPDPNCVAAPVFGACCFVDGACLLLTGAECAGQGGAYQGDGTTCPDPNCVAAPVFGACCFVDGACLLLTGAECAGQGGAYQGDATACPNPNCAAAPTEGACCLPDDSCELSTPAGCGAMGGTFFGVGTPCELVACGVSQVDSCLRASVSEKGSLVIYSKVELRWDGVTSELIQDTFLTLTNEAVEDVRVVLYFINGDEPLAADPNSNERAHPGWNKFNNAFNLTAHETRCWRASDGGGGVAPWTALDPGDPPGRPAMDGSTDRVLRGYVVGFAIDPLGAEIRWNHLFGTGTIVHYADAFAWDYPTWNHPVVADVPSGTAPDGISGQLNLDGIEYASGFNRVVLPFQAFGSDKFSGPGAQVVSDFDLTLHPNGVDLRADGNGPETTRANIITWNENESEFSEMYRCITCWDETLGSLYTADLLGVINAFDRMVIGTDAGYARIDGVTSMACNVDVDPADGPIGSHPLDVVSVDAALLGVYARVLRMTAGAPSVSATGYPVTGTGEQTAVILHRPTGGGSEEAGAGPDLPMAPTPAEIRRFLDAAIDAARAPVR